MDLTTTPTPTTTPDTDNDTPPHTQQVKHFSSYANGTVKKYHFPYHLHYLHHHHHHQTQPFVEGVGGISITYRECLKNHAASLGGHALDGCGEFMASSTVDPTDPSSLKCAACGCHRNFHRREPDEYSSPMIPHFLDFRHPSAGRSSPSPSPPPPQPQPTQSFAPQMLLALSSAAHEDHQLGFNHHQQVATPVTPTAVKSENLSGRKRFRTKFTQEQKEKMHSFSEKLGWKLQKCDDAMVKDFCNEIGVARGVLKVWMHNNKNTLGKREITTTTTNNNNNNNGTPTTIINTTTTTISGSRATFDNGSSHNMNSSSNNNNEAENNTNASHYHSETRDAVHLHTSTNGSSSSS